MNQPSKYSACAVLLAFAAGCALTGLLLHRQRGVGSELIIPRQSAPVARWSFLG